MPQTQGSPKPEPAAPSRGITVRPPVLVGMSKADWEEAVRLAAVIAADDRADSDSAA